MKTVCIYLSPDTIEQLDDLAQRTGRTRSNTIRRILEKSLPATPPPPVNPRDVWPG